MSDYISEIFGRMNLCQLRSFLLNGTEDYDEEMRPYRETLKRGSDPIYKRLEGIYPDGPELDKATADISKALTTYEYVYMELGMKAGARLLHHLLLSNESM